MICKLHMVHSSIEIYPKNYIFLNISIQKYKNCTLKKVTFMGTKKKRIKFFSTLRINIYFQKPMSSVRYRISFATYGKNFFQVINFPEHQKTLDLNIAKLILQNVYVFEICKNNISNSH